MNASSAYAEASERPADTADPRVTTADRIRESGYALQRGCFLDEEVRAIRCHIDAYVQQAHPGIVYEDDSRLIRGIHGPHLYDAFFADMVSDPRFLATAEQFLGERCYVHQFKINMKQRMNGQAWPWHQDYIYWKNGDGIENPDLLNVAMLLNDVDMLHGPLCFIPRSHTGGDLSEDPDRSGDWRQDLSKDLTYQVGHGAVDRLIRDNGIEFITGKAGDVVFFDPLLAHCSSTNLSPQDRVLLIVTYNAVSNAPRPGHHRIRPEFLCARDFTPL